MAHFPDLSPCPYFGKAKADKLVAVGWLDSEHTFPNGEADELFMDKLIDLLVKPWAPMYFLGYADCPFCTLDSYGITYERQKDRGRRAEFIRATRGVPVCCPVHDRPLYPRA